MEKKVQSKAGQNVKIPLHGKTRQMAVSFRKKNDIFSNFYSVRNYFIRRSFPGENSWLEKLSPHVYHLIFILIDFALIDTIWSTSVHPKCKYSGSALLSLFIAVHRAFMLHQVEATWLKAEGPSLPCLSFVQY